LGKWINQSATQKVKTAFGGTWRDFRSRTYQTYKFHNCVKFASGQIARGQQLRFDYSINYSSAAVRRRFFLECDELLCQIEAYFRGYFYMVIVFLHVTTRVSF